MCGDSCTSTRLSSGGTIAVLRSPHDATGQPVTNEPVASCDLLFDNPTKTASARTRAVLRARDGVSFDSLKTYFMLIHRDGDLRTRASMSDEVRTALHAIELKPAVDEHQNHALMDLPGALDLNVGTERGVIGRRVSIVRGGERVAEGIIGYN
ncbi:uncharacterized protein J3D65DRAFT_663589 [Phyllosticta citribraziliensis]|uniref:Uncharacterized protein n=1 Tax=Phyllosticta citribraziliensis TaxID=989973 RepID=A0ABR1MAQ8_9PEZI